MTKNPSLPRIPSPSVCRNHWKFACPKMRRDPPQKELFLGTHVSSALRTWMEWQHIRSWNTPSVLNSEIRTMAQQIVASVTVTRFSLAARITLQCFNNTFV